MKRLRRIETWARLGLTARGLVYLLLGGIALSTGRALSAGGAVEAFEGLPGGELMLIALAIGLFGYGFYKVYAAAVDLDSVGREAKGLAIRAGWAIGGFAYWALAWIALRRISAPPVSGPGRAGGSNGAEQAAAEQVAQTGGDVLLMAIGLIVLAIAAGQLWAAWTASFMRNMAGSPGWARPAGRIGYAARAVVIAIVGWFLLRAGSSGEHVRGFDDALALLRDGYRLIFTGIAGGLALFGLTSLVMARYLNIRDEDVVDRIEQAAERARPTSRPASASRPAR